MKRFGECAIGFEPPDVVVTVLAGQITAAQVNAMYDEYERIEEAGAPPHFSLIDLREFKVPTTEVRRIAMVRARKFVVPAGTAVCGGSFRMRAIPTLFFHALTLLDERHRRSTVRFFEREAEGRAWIAEVRRARGG